MLSPSCCLSQIAFTPSVLILDGLSDMLGLRREGPELCRTLASLNMPDLTLRFWPWQGVTSQRGQP